MNNKRDISHNQKTFAETDQQILKKIKVGSQIHKVYLYLKEEGNLTVNKSIQLWGYYYLPVSINRLRKHGANIKDMNMGEGQGKYKKSRIKKHAEYKLVK